MKKLLLTLILMLPLVLQAQTVDNFTLTDIDGNTFVLADKLAEDKSVLIYFFFTGCPNCAGTTPKLQQIYESVGGEDACMEILAFDVDPNEDIPAIQAYQDNYGVDFTFFNSQSNANAAVIFGMISSQFNGSAATPSTILINPDYSVAYKDQGNDDYYNDVLEGEINSTIPTDCASTSTEILNTSSIAIYPNPTTDFVQFQTDTPLNYELYNIKGELIQTANGFSVDLTNLNESVYYLKVNDQTQKILKMN